MAELEPGNPFMQVVWWKEKPYYTSRYFHAWYLVNSQEKQGRPKYQRFDNFMRRLRTIESYPLFVEREDIVVLSPQEQPSILEGWPADNPPLDALFVGNHHKPVTLISAAFQLELAHHLDTPQDREIAYRHSKSTAEAQPKQAPAPRQKWSLSHVKGFAASIIAITEDVEGVRLEVGELRREVRAGNEGHSRILEDVQDKQGELQHQVDRLADVANPSYIAEVVSDLVTAQIEKHRPSPRPTPWRSQEGPPVQQAFRVSAANDVTLPPPGTMSIYEYLERHKDEVLFTLVTRTDRTHFHRCCRYYETPYQYRHPNGRMTNFYQPETIRKACVDYQRWLQLGRVPSPLRYRRAG